VSNKEEALKQKINDKIETRKHLWTCIILLTGGLAGIVLNSFNIKTNAGYYINTIFLFIGLILDYFFFNSIVSTNKEIKNFINQLEKGE